MNPSAENVAYHKFGGDFSGAMPLNLNTETRSWIGNPDPVRLSNDKLNTTLVDCVRAWLLVKVSK